MTEHKLAQESVWRAHRDLSLSDIGDEGSGRYLMAAFSREGSDAYLGTVQDVLGLILRCFASVQGALKSNNSGL